ncbi:hypothetical protein [Jeotgalibacillus haloalkalitolerans]|uniref:Uncharacterized protein n=1 Tax=Jeotgalibacillus haloalkalitolerans TaxID=3104292 RepID=A0ABU5KLF1_9BACL|nr:hypothetical protein [Jeotgalibacillus sp. HH7-29]MDZ5711540.1 hypothetical protein [Jeotgalibacillus sp. HH7-29]
MDINEIWQRFISLLDEEPGIVTAEWRISAGIPFLYLHSITSDRQEIEQKIKRCAVRAMRGKRLNAETIFVRAENEQWVYRHRFYVPQEKMFCCGNLCSDCIRFR